MQPHDMNGRDANAIAAELERERAELAHTLNGLRDRLSVDALLGDAMDYARANLGGYAKALDGAVRANPAAAVMAGVGLAWLVLGRRSPVALPEPVLAGTKFEALSRWEDEGGPVAPLPDPDNAWIAEADGLRQTAMRSLARLDAAARSGVSPALDVARRRAEVLAQLARATRAAMLRGLEGMTAGAQETILAARERAYAARNGARRRGARMIEDQPLAAGAIGMAIGAAVGSVLPRTEIEDRILGAERDRLLAEAQRVLRQERDRAAGAGARLAGKVAAEVKETAVGLVSDAG